MIFSHTILYVTIRQTFGDIFTNRARSAAYQRNK